MRKNKKVFTPVKEVLSIINSCETIEQINSCRNLIDNYMISMEKKGLVNPVALKNRLIKELKQKTFQITMIKSFIVRHQREYEKEFSLTA